MSITRLQQARQMYALGKLVERVGFQGGGRDAGAGSGFGDGPSSNGGDKDRPNPHTASGTSKTSTPTSSPTSSDGPTNIHVDDPNAPPAYEIIGGKKYDVTPATIDIRERAKVKQAILNPTVKRNKIFDPISKNFINPFATTQDPFSLKNIAKNIFLGIVAPQLLAKTKLGPAINTFNQVNRVAGLFDKNIDVKNTISNMFSGNKTTTSKSTSKNNTTNNGGKGDGEGLASLENQAGGYDEYILLLQKLQSGNISDSERNRFNVLKNMLGI